LVPRIFMAVVGATLYVDSSASSLGCEKFSNGKTESPVS
jgi:hypothetical protein